MNGLRAGLIGAGIGLLTVLPVAPAPATAADAVTLVATVPGAHDIAADHRGTVYVTDPARHRILAVRGGTPTVFAEQLAEPAGLGVDAADNVYVGTQYGRILRFTPAGARTLFATGKAAVLALTVDAAGDVYWADATTVWKATPAGQVSRFFSAPRPAALAPGPHGSLFVATGTQVLQVAPDGTRVQVATSPARALTSDGDLYMSDGCTVRRYPAGPVPAVCAAALSFAGGSLYYTDAKSGAIGRVDPPAAASATAPADTASAPASAAPAAAEAPDGGGGAWVAGGLLAAVAVLAAAGGTLAHRRTPLSAAGRGHH
ncbi:hypothetical protein [Dactylosporangium matsuzakiense]|uniref:NHL repeat-containing protein n=1 Tax=Dactylosporangium matsuzakiense TaxID=53360 RepID=A0A9W6KKU5_9ACTN|nr:hypothetical protein [Dactylosporangium matsuzakiense]UWZ41562.1 hypothetical protein Dmats_28345 [Dactylosporangium matsuzakiense]GLL02374.1 hypothetical protein GCM10017581_041160 [Dactylosporangium matsuzakiense]